MWMASTPTIRVSWRRSARACGPVRPYGVIRLAQEYGIALQGVRATVVGASNIVGRPMALELMLAGATVTVCHTRTRDLRAEVERAELIVSRRGQARHGAGGVDPSRRRRIRCGHQPDRGRAAWSATCNTTRRRNEPPGSRRYPAGSAP